MSELEKASKEWEIAELKKPANEPSLVRNVFIDGALWMLEQAKALSQQSNVADVDTTNFVYVPDLEKLCKEKK